MRELLYSFRPYRPPFLGIRLTIEDGVRWTTRHWRAGETDFEIGLSVAHILWRLPPPAPHTAGAAHETPVAAAPAPRRKAPPGPPADSVPLGWRGSAHRASGGSPWRRDSECSGTGRP